MKKIYESGIGIGQIPKKLLLVMKLTALLLVVFTMHVTATVYSQNARLTLNMQGNTIKEVLQQIEAQSEYRFIYENEKVKLDTKVSIRVKDEPVENILKKLFENDGVNYLITENNLILINPSEKKVKDLGSETGNFQQQKSITGKVTDASGTSLPGVSVVVKGTTIGTITDGNGNYSLSNVPQNATVQFSFVGMKQQETTVAGKSVINVSLEEDSIGIEEVVAVGYGSVKKSDLTGTISNVKTEKTKDIPNTNVLQSLQGRVAGLNVVTPDRPGEDPSVGIRGINSISAGNRPLIVVDGIIYNGSLNDFNVNDIESIDVLKDASAAAVYGSRSSNGVIIITSKMGKTEKPVFDFSSYYGVSDPTYLIPIKDGPGYIQKILDFRTAIKLEADPNKIENYLTASEAENYKNGKTVNWYDKIIKNGITQNYSLNVSGRTDKTDYYLSGTYYDQEGIVDNDNYKRITLKANFTNKITDWYTISLKTAFSSMDYSGVPAGLYYGLSPYGTYWEDESKGTYKKYPMEDPFFTHPMWNMMIDNKDLRTSLLGTFSSELNVPFVKGLKWTLNYSTNLRNQKVKNFWDNNMPTGGGTTSNGVAQKEILDNYDWTLDNIVNYKRKFLDAHSIDLTLLYSREYQSYEQTLAKGSDFFNQGLGYNSLDLAMVQQVRSDLQDQNSVAYMARLNYIFNSKYLLTATVRRDGFSGFAAGNKYAIFPSVALAWTVTNEEFLQNVDWLNLIKLRISYGENGNQSLGRYQTLARIANSQYVFGDGGSTVTTSYLGSMANNQLSWEITRVKNLGIDFGILKNVLTGTVDAYSSNTFNILLNRNIPATSGYSTVWTNIGEVHNEGVEITLNSVNLNKKGFTWETGFTFSLNRNKIVHLLGEDLDGDGKEDDNLANSWFIGKPLGVIYGYQTDGIYQLTDTNIPVGFSPGDFRLVDTDGIDGLTPEDRTILGSTLPNYIFSLSNTLQYKNWSLYFLINSVQGGGKDNYYVGNNMAMNNVNNQFSTWTERFNVVDVPYWTPENPSNEYSKINYIPNRPHPYMEDRSFVRLQDINFSYTLNKIQLEKIKLQGLRIYVSGKNLYTWTKWSGYDPETSASIGDFPMLRTFALGIDFKF